MKILLDNILHVQYHFQEEIHAEYECKILSTKKPIKIQDYNRHHPVYECILTLRCLLLREKDPERWVKLNTMEHHNNLRQTLDELWQRNEVNTVQFLREVYNIDFDAEIIHTVLGFADINAFEIKRDDVAYVN